MGLRDDFRKMAGQLADRFDIPPIEQVFFPPLQPGGQPRDSEFMAMCLKGGAAGVSYVLLPAGQAGAYSRLRNSDFIGRDPVDYALRFGSDDPVENMISLAALNCVCRQVFEAAGCSLDHATDSLGLLDISAGDRVGMVGLFPPLLKQVRERKAELVVIELDETLVEKYPGLHVTLDPVELSACNKVICTSTTVMNQTLGGILENCSPGAKVSVIGPTAGYFPDPLFNLGVDSLGGTYIHDGALFMQLIAERRKWTPAKKKICFQKATYKGLPSK